MTAPDGTALTTGPPASAGGLAAPRARAADVPDARRWLQLALAALWLFDGMLQFQRFMFSKGFSQMVAATAAGNPAVVAAPIQWSSRLIAAHPAGTDATFAAIQVLIGLGIASRRTVRTALAVSIAWAIAVWWLGEGLGGVLSGGASPVTGAPGAVILYALLAVLLWPAGESQDTHAVSPFAAASGVGVTAARAVWVVLWGSLAYFALTPANRAPLRLHDVVAGLASGEPGWLAAVDRGTASLLGHQGLAASLLLAFLLAVIALGVFLPWRASRVTLGVAIILSLVIWVAGQDLGTILTGGGTDPNSGLLLVLVALAYWPARRDAATRGGAGDPA